MSPTTINNPPSPPTTSTSTRSRNETTTAIPNSLISDHHGSDLEKIETAEERGGNALDSTRVSRIQSLTRRTTRAGQWFHPLSNVKTGLDCLVDFDGKDDPYRPVNWPFRKKFITTLLYGLTTMGSTWASSVLVLILYIPLALANCVLAIRLQSIRYRNNLTLEPRFRF